MYEVEQYNEWQPENIPKDVKDFADIDDVHMLSSYNSLIAIREFGKISRVFFDGFEPEDASFNRDLSWITRELTAAYTAGIRDASNII